jgi:hypothetical protein
MALDPWSPGHAGLARWGFPLALLTLAALSCGGPAGEREAAPAPGEWRSFEGTGTATGQRQTLHLGPGRKVSIVNLTGSLVLVGERRLGQGFRSEVLGYTDTLKGGTAWSVWTDNRGDQVFGEFRGGPIGTGSRFTGTLLGGTGRYAGVTGEYEFEWQYVLDEEDGSIQGRITGLRGRFRQNAPSSPPPPGTPVAPDRGRPRS